MRKILSEIYHMRAIVDSLKDTPDLLNALLCSLYIYLRNPSCKSPYFIDLLRNVHDRTTVYQLAREIKRRGISFTFEDLISLFEYVISPSTRIVTGSVYTPKNIRRYIIENLLSPMPTARLNSCSIVDFSCGCGAFLVDAAEYIHIRTRKPIADICRENLFGFDINDFAIERCRLLLSIMAITYGESAPNHFNLHACDALSLKDDSTLYDVVVGNPPYVCARKMNAETKNAVKRWEFASDGNSDLYLAFFQLAVTKARAGGHIGLIIPNGFLKSLNARVLRACIQRRRPSIRIIDFKGTQVFKSRCTYTCICLIENKESPYVLYAVDEEMLLPRNPVFQRIPYASLDSRRGWNLNNTEFVIRIEAHNNTIGNTYTMRHGIATLSNRIFILPKQPQSDLYTIQDGDKIFTVESSICKKIINSNALKDKTKLEDAVHPIIYPYREASNGHVELIPEAELAENFPNAYLYLQYHRNTLLSRDKGSISYPWYAYGRTQSLKLGRYKLFIPKISRQRIHSWLVDDKDLFFYNGLAFVSEKKSDLLFLKKIVDSDIFWEYVKSNSKAYSSGYYALDNLYIKQFGIPTISRLEKDKLINSKSHTEAEEYINQLWRIRRV